MDAFLRVLLKKAEPSDFQECSGAGAGCAYWAPVPLPAFIGTLLGPDSLLLVLQGKKSLGTSDVFKTWCIVNSEIWFKKTKHLFNVYFFWVTWLISGTHLYILLEAGGCRAWSEAVILFHLSSMGWAGSRYWHCMSRSMAWDTDSW